MMTAVAVRCTFAADGAVRVRQVKLDGRWRSVEQGRQWRDKNGRYCLIMLPDNQVRRLHLRPDTLAWELETPTPPTTLV